MSSISSTSDQLHLLDSLSDLKEHLIKIIEAGNYDVKIFSRELNPLLFNDTKLAELLSGLARKDRKSEVRILVQEPKALIEAKHQLLHLYRRLPSKIHMQKLTSEPQNDYAFVIVDNDKLWLQHKEDGETGFANYDARPEVKRFSTIFSDLWKNSVLDTELNQLTL